MGTRLSHHGFPPACPILWEPPASKLGSLMTKSTVSSDSCQDSFVQCDACLLLCISLLLTNVDRFQFHFCDFFRYYRISNILHSAFVSLINYRWVSAVARLKIDGGNYLCFNEEVMSSLSHHWLLNFATSTKEEALLHICQLRYFNIHEIWP